MEVAVE